VYEEMWTYREPMATGVDLTGFKVEALDGSIGKVDEATYDTGVSYVVVDTGPWIFGKKVVLPARTIQQVDPDDNRVFVDRTKDDIKNAPEYDPDAGMGDEAYRDKLGAYYGGFYTP
jgi:hypothetical protein